MNILPKPLILFFHQQLTFAGSVLAVEVPFDKAFAFWKKQGIAPTVFPYGHYTSFISRLEIRKLIMGKL